MKNRILGLHHITAIAGDAQRNYDFYTKVLGVRLVKKTVNFDDPGTYHFYFGDEVGTSGSILTFFPWEGIKKAALARVWLQRSLIPYRKEALTFGKLDLKNRK
jgi:catechol 2,3-dioxygenase-like lactoylglutathione lyase family enzyme